MLAARSGNTKAISTLLRYGADVRIASSDKRTALYVAREHNQKKVAKILIKAGAEELSSPVPSGKMGAK